MFAKGYMPKVITTDCQVEAFSRPNLVHSEKGLLHIGSISLNNEEMDS